MTSYQKLKARIAELEKENKELKTDAMILASLELDIKRSDWYDIVLIKAKYVLMREGVNLLYDTNYIMPLPELTIPEYSPINIVAQKLGILNMIK